MRGARFSGHRARKTECTGDSDSAPCTLRRRSVPGALKSAPVGLDQCGAACCAALNRAPQSHLQRPALTVPIGKHPGMAGKHPGMAFMFPIPVITARLDDNRHAACLQSARRSGIYLPCMAHSDLALPAPPSDEKGTPEK